MRLLVQETKLDRMNLPWAFLGPSSLKVYCVFECEVPEQGEVFLLENSGSEETLFPHQLKLCYSHLPVRVTKTLPAASLP